MFRPSTLICEWKGWMIELKQCILIFILTYFSFKLLPFDWFVSTYYELSFVLSFWVSLGYFVGVAAVDSCCVASGLKRAEGDKGKRISEVCIGTLRTHVRPVSSLFFPRGFIIKTETNAWFTRLVYFSSKKLVPLDF